MTPLQYSTDLIHIIVVYILTLNSTETRPHVRTRRDEVKHKSRNIVVLLIRYTSGGHNPPVLVGTGDVLRGRVRIRHQKLNLSIFQHCIPQNK